MCVCVCVCVCDSDVQSNTELFHLDAVFNDLPASRSPSTPHSSCSHSHTNKQKPRERESEGETFTQMN